MSGGPIGEQQELGLCQDSIRVSPKFAHANVHQDDWGPTVPNDVLWDLATADIDMTLIHWDQQVLEICLMESMGGKQRLQSDAGIMQPTGSLLGGMTQPLASGCHFITLTLNPMTLPDPYRFRTSYILGPPLEIPLGTEATAVKMSWRAIPYNPPTAVVDFGKGTSVVTEGSSSGVPLWTRPQGL